MDPDEYVSKIDPTSIFVLDFSGGVFKTVLLHMENFSFHNKNLYAIGNFFIGSITFHGNLSDSPKRVSNRKFFHHVEIRMSRSKCCGGGQTLKYSTFFRF